MQSKLRNLKLKKIKSKMIVEALVTGASSRGNHSMSRHADFPGNNPVVMVFYMNTPIATVTLENGSIVMRSVNAGQYDNTVATMRQRKDLKSAVEEIKEAVGLC